MTFINQTLTSIKSSLTFKLQANESNLQEVVVWDARITYTELLAQRVEGRGVYRIRAFCKYGRFQVGRPGISEYLKIAGSFALPPKNPGWGQPSVCSVSIKK